MVGGSGAGFGRNTVDVKAATVVAAAAIKTGKDKAYSHVHAQKGHAFLLLVSHSRMQPGWKARPQQLKATTLVRRGNSARQIAHSSSA